MKNLARQGLTHEQVYHALHAQSGSKNIAFRYDVLRNGVTYATVDAVDGSISFNQDNEINRTARFTIVGETDIAWVSDMIKPYLLLKVQVSYQHFLADWQYIRSKKMAWKEIRERKQSWNQIRENRHIVEEVYQWAEFPLGVFVLSTPQKRVENGLVLYEVEAYDKTIILKEDCITDRLYIAKDTNYIIAIKQLMMSANLVDVRGDASATVLPTDREFEVGTSKLEIVNKLLSEINFEPITVDADGVFVLKKYSEPKADNISYRYHDDELSVMYNDTFSERDFYSVPNVFIAVVSNPELKQDIKAVYVNDNKASQLSTASRGRKIVSEIYRPDVISNQEDLDAYIRKIAFEKSQVWENISFTTDLMPIHERAEVLEVRNRSGDVSGIYAETAWSMQLSCGGTMTHDARRLSEI